MESAGFLKTRSFLAVWTSTPILKMLGNAEEMEAVAAGERSEVLGELRQTDGACGDLVEVVAGQPIFLGGVHWRAKK